MVDYTDVSRQFIGLIFKGEAPANNEKPKQLVIPQEPIYHNEAGLYSTY